MDSRQKRPSRPPGLLSRAEGVPSSAMAPGELSSAAPGSARVRVHRVKPLGTGERRPQLQTRSEISFSCRGVISLGARPGLEALLPREVLASGQARSSCLPWWTAAEGKQGSRRKGFMPLWPRPGVGCRSWPARAGPTVLLCAPPAPCPRPGHTLSPGPRLPHQPATRSPAGPSGSAVEVLPRHVLPSDSRSSKGVFLSQERAFPCAEPSSVGREGSEAQGRGRGAVRPSPGVLARRVLPLVPFLKCGRGIGRSRGRAWDVMGSSAEREACAGGRGARAGVRRLSPNQPCLGVPSDAGFVLFSCSRQNFTQWLLRTDSDEFWHLPPI